MNYGEGVAINLKISSSLWCCGPNILAKSPYQGTQKTVRVNLIALGFAIGSGIIQTGPLNYVGHTTFLTQHLTHTSLGCSLCIWIKPLPVTLWYSVSSFPDYEDETSGQSDLSDEGSTIHLCNPQLESLPQQWIRGDSIMT